MSYQLPEVTLVEALLKLEKDAQDPVYYHGRVAARLLEYIKELQAKTWAFETLKNRLRDDRTTK